MKKFGLQHRRGLRGERGDRTRYFITRTHKAKPQPARDPCPLRASPGGAKGKDCHLVT